MLVITFALPKLSWQKLANDKVADNAGVGDNPKQSSGLIWFGSFRNSDVSRHSDVSNFTAEMSYVFGELRSK